MKPAQTVTQLIAVTTKKELEKETAENPMRQKKHFKNFQEIEEAATNHRNPWAYIALGDYYNNVHTINKNGKRIQKNEIDKNGQVVQQNSKKQWNVINWQWNVKLIQRNVVDLHSLN